MSDMYMISGITGALGRAGIAEGTNSGTIQISAPNGAGIDYAINGVAYHKADTDNIAVTAATAQAVLTTAAYLVQINAAGTVSTKQSNVVLNADLTAGANNVQWPSPDANNCPLGGFVITCTSSATFTPGTTDISASNILSDFYSFALGMPADPITAVAT